MANEPRRSPPEPDDPIADAAALFQESSPTRPAPTRQVGPSDPGAGYDVEELADEPAEPLPTPAPPFAAPKARSRERLAPEPVADRELDGVGMGEDTRPARRRPEAEATVDEVWTRGAEWGSTLVGIGVVAAGLVVVLYMTMATEHYGLAFLELIGGGVLLALLAYPILVTLERPVRITPEQAVRDFYVALSHHWPHHKRMWLLLSSAGRVSGSFASFEGFRRYWQTRITELKAGHAGSFTPLKFVVEDFKSAKAAGLTEVDASYTVKIYVRGKQSEGPIETVRVKRSFVKGPDRMWYLNRGTLP